MASLKDLIVLGPARFLDKLYGNLEGNAATATKLQTPRAINGTNFDGTGSITTANWGTSRNITIGSKTKSVNGSTTYNWTHAEIGATVSNTWAAGTTAGPKISTTVNGVTGTAVEIPSASTSASGVVTTGDQRFRGIKTLEYPAITSNATRYQGYYYKSSGGTLVGDHWIDIGDASKVTQGVMYWRLYSPKATADTTTTGYYEQYLLPAVTIGRSTNASYEIFTSKNYTTLDGRYVNVSGDTMTGKLTLNTTVVNHANPTEQALVINCGQVPSGGTLTDKNAPGIGFHIGSNSWGSLILNGGKFKFIDNTATGYLPVYASTFYGALSGNASTATKLQTPRAINGTNFDGSAAITTANWGTARTLTIGNKGQSVNGSTNYSWELHDILYNTSGIATATSWDITTPGVYHVASSSAFTGTSNPESANGGTTPYRYGQLIVSRASTGGMAQFYISHNDSGTNTGYGIKFRTGWNNSYLGTWRTLMDSTNYTNWCDSRYINTAGDTMTGALNFANGTWNTMGDDAYIGDYNQAGMIGIKGKNGNTGIYFAPYSGSTAQTITINGSGTMTISGTVASTFSGNLSGNATTATKLATARNITTNLASTSAASFNGTANITPGVTGTLPLGNGGTGVTSLNALRKLFREWAPINTSNDTTSSWGAKGLSVAGYSADNTITDKPSTYGIILNVNSGDSEVHQLWFTQSSGALYHRGGNASGWNGSWRLMYSDGDSVIYSSSEPTSKVKGTIWLKPA